jgi:hypothetical protein
MVAKLAVLLAERVMKDAGPGVTLPIATPLIVPPVIATADAFCVAIVPNPVT